MAYDGPNILIPGALSSGDLSSNQFRLVKKNTTAKQYALCDTAGERAHGVLLNKPSAASKAAEVLAFGVTKIRAGGTLTAGDMFTTDASGQAVTVAATSIQDHKLGHVIEGAAVNELATVLFNPEGSG